MSNYKDIKFNNDKYINNIINNNYIYKDNYKIKPDDKIDYFKQAYSFDQLMQLVRAYRRANNASATANRPSTARSNTQSRQTTSTMWSPISWSGTVYKYNRGVIGIGIDGDKKEIVLDGNNRHHSDATTEIGNLLDCPVDNPTDNPFVNATSVIEKGAIIIQLEGDSMMVYLPEMISTEQYQQLITELNPRNNFKTITYYHMEQIYDGENITIENLIAYCNSILATRSIKRG